MSTIKNYELVIKRVNLGELGAPYGQQVTQAEDVSRMAQYLIGDSAQEKFYVFMVDIKNRVIGFHEAARGGNDSCFVDIRVVLRMALVAGAAGLVVSHCHPSGDPTPSNADVDLTHRLKAACVIVGLQLLDHVVVAGDKSFSMRMFGLV